MQRIEGLPKEIIVLDIETAGLAFQDDFISCIGFYRKDGVIQFSCKYEDEEENMIRRFLDYLFPENPLLVTYNGNLFDFPFLAKRMERYSLERPKLFDSLHIDLMEFVTSTNERRISKEVACRKYGDLYVPRMCDGKYIARQYKHGLVDNLIHSKMLQHNAVDVTATFQLYDCLTEHPDFLKWIDVKSQREEGKIYE